MNLAGNPPVLPMLAKRVGELPLGEGWIFEPKWDGFRALVFRDGDEIFIQSRDEKPLNRYFPEVKVIGESQFWKLVESATRSRKGKRGGKGTRRA
jgi:ATP-dependent DNA ligase